jgi:hypothetical protein
MLFIDISNIVTITDGVEFPSYLSFEQASSKTHFQPVQSSFRHYELVSYSIAKEGNVRPRKARFWLQGPFSGKLVFYRIRNNVISHAGELISASKSHFRVTLISIHDDLRFTVRTHE